MWVVKAKGETYYVNHVDCTVPWSTKETSDNPHTKGSIKIKNCLVTIGDDNHAVITQLTKVDEIRLNGQKFMTRFITSQGNTLKKLLETLNLDHGPIKLRGGGCHTTWYITEVSEEDSTILLLHWPSVANLRALKPNEEYYKWYSSEVDDNEEEFEEDDFIDQDDEEEAYA